MLSIHKKLAGPTYWKSRIPQKIYFGKEENKEIAAKMRQVFAEWIDNGHNNFDDVNTCILRIDLTEGVMLTPDKRYEIDFTK